MYNSISNADCYNQTERRKWKNFDYMQTDVKKNSIYIKENNKKNKYHF